MSSYQVLARKYRPKTFGDIAGQEVLTKVLQGAIREDRVGHAYLFAGPRGTGKTTTARVLAKALICERGPAPEPCGECEHCRDVDALNHLDVHEIDAASNTSVEDVRTLREQVAYTPMRARYKVYIVDEVHMLSKSAFNAFLKTLEEPPPHVVFLFATTEPHKVLDTVLSRCQVLHLSLIPEEVIAARIADIFEREDVQCEEGVPLEIGRLARGSLRDALSFCDQLLALVGSAPSLADVQRVGGDGEGRADELLDLAAAGERAALLLALPDEEGGEAHLLDLCLESLRASLMDVLRGDGAPPSPLAAGTEELRRRRAERARKLGPERPAGLARGAPARARATGAAQLAPARPTRPGAGPPGAVSARLRRAPDRARRAPRGPRSTPGRAGCRVAARAPGRAGHAAQEAGQAGAAAGRGARAPRAEPRRGRGARRGPRPAPIGPGDHGRVRAGPQGPFAGEHRGAAAGPGCRGRVEGLPSGARGHPSDPGDAARAQGQAARPR